MRLAALSLAFLAWSGLAMAQEHASLDMALKLARERAYRAEHIRWDEIEVAAREVARTQGEHYAIGFALKSLNDGHSFYRPPPKLAPAEPATGPVSGGAPRVLSTLGELRGGIPIIQINGWSGSERDAFPATAALRSHVKSALAEPRCGVVLDFSGNSGGNMWPMLVGLSPLLSEGVLGSFRSAAGANHVIEKRAGSILFRRAVHPLNQATDLLPSNRAGRVAVVVGAKSASSGEIVPIMFHGQSNVRFFGTQTAGLSTANSTFRLPNGGLANITTAVTLDRNGRVFAEHIEPEVVSEHPLEEAARWISSGCHADER